MFTTYDEAQARATELGAVRVGISRPHPRAGAFCAHFFDVNGSEVGFYHYDLNRPLFELSPRREWCAAFLSQLEFSEV